MRSFLVALAFLTIMPIRFAATPSAAVVARSRFWFPVVGLLLGALLGGWTALTVWLRAPLLAALLILGFWVVITGALHLDGMADVCDGVFGGSTPDERLRIMKDPRVGSFGVIGLVLLLLAKFVMLVRVVELLPGPAPWLIGAAVLLARCHVLALASLGHYPRSEGTGKAIIEATRRWEGLAQLLLTFLIVGGLAYHLVPMQYWAGMTLWWWLPSPILVLLLHGLFAVRLGGTTGDCLGAAIELIETLFLFECVL